jgi:hypothetical protein
LDFARHLRERSGDVACIALIDADWMENRGTTAGWRTLAKPLSQQSVWTMLRAMLGAA